jgi:hypothetical protein
MASYRLYFLNDAGHIIGAADLFADTDSEALSRALDIAMGRPVELWQAARRVLAWPANASSAHPPGAAEAS